MNVDKDFEDKLKYLNLKELLTHWDETISQARKAPSYTKFLKQIIDREYAAKKERARLQRIRSAKFEETYGIETFPFERQPGIAKKKIMELFDSMTYMTKKQNIIFMGPTGVGKTGLSTSLLVHAINSGASGRFVTFPDLLTELYQSSADHSEKKVLNRFLSYDALLIDEMGYIDIEPHQAGLFFTLMKKRHKKHTTIITTQLGFSDWNAFLKNAHLTSALVGRITENSQLFNMNKCVSIRETSVPTELS